RGAAATAGRCGPGRRGFRGGLGTRVHRDRRHVRAADDRAADVADLDFVLAAFVSAGFPSDQRLIERDGCLVVRALERNVVEPDRLPPRRFEWGRRRGLAGGWLQPARLAT